MRASTSRTAGEQAIVFSLKSSRNASRQPSGGWYSFMARTRARGSGNVVRGRSAINSTSVGNAAQAHANSLRVANKTLRFRQKNGLRAQHLHSALVVLLHRDQLHKIIHAQS